MRPTAPDQPASTAGDRPDAPAPAADAEAAGESPGGISPPGALRSGREPLDSSGSHHPALGSTPRRQWAKRVGSGCARLAKNLRARPARPQPLVLPRGPTNEVVVDMSERPDQRRRIEAAVVVDPPPHDRIAEPCQVSEGDSTPEMQPPALGRLPDRFRGLVTHRRTEADKQVTASAPCSASAKRVAEEIKRLVL